MSHPDNERAVDLHIATVSEGGKGAGGWGAVLRWGTAVREIQGNELATSGSRELQMLAVATGLRALTRSAPVRLHSDRPGFDLAPGMSSRVFWAGRSHEDPDGARATALAGDALQKAIKQLEALCIHELTTRSCWQCRPQAAGLPARVKVTSGGLVYHLDEACPALHDGWRKLERRGGIRSSLDSVPMVDALARGFGACEVCGSVR